MKSIKGRRLLISAAATLFFFLLLVVVAVLSLPSSITRTNIRCCALSINQQYSNARILLLAAAPPKSLFQSENNRGRQRQKLGRRDRKKRLDELQQQRRRNRWMKRYGTVEALQRTFGTGPPWGDLTPTQTRSLYHTLLPRSLLALNEMGLVKVEDLAPLAYEARIAAKNYARSRCIWTGRVGVFLFDQYRSLRDKGRLVRPGTSSSMSWEEIWAKYESQIVREQRERGREPLDEDELMMQTYMRILEKSCSTNEAVDNLFLKDDEDIDGVDISLASIASQLEQDVRAILLSPSEITKAEKTRKKLEKKQLKEREKEEKKQLKQREKYEKMRRKVVRKKEKRKRRLRW